MDKKALIEKYLNEPVKIGESVYIKGLGTKNPDAFFNKSEIIDIINDGQTIIYKEYGMKQEVSISDIKKDVKNIGVDPFDESLWRKVENINYNLGSILFQLGFEDELIKSKYTTDKGFTIKPCNMNPFVEINGEKRFYQRAFVWTLEDMQSLVHSIYNRIECGKIVIRRRGWDWLHSREDANECYWYDVVDGKQRLTTLVKFMNNEFTDKYGNYYSDLSEMAQHKFTNHQLFSYNEMKEDVTDEDVLKQFLSINFAGIPQSVEHINFVESLLKL